MVEYERLNRRRRQGTMFEVETFEVMLEILEKRRTSNGHWNAVPRLRRGDNVRLDCLRVRL